MAGDNHHHIPRFLQAWFAIPKTRRREIWFCERDSLPEQKLIKKVGAEDKFYTEEVDSDITDLETPLARLVAKVRALEVGAAVEPVDAADIIFKLAPRTAHFRATMQRGLSALIEQLFPIFGEEASVQALMGLDAQTPSARFKERFQSIQDDMPALIQETLPPPVLERVTFYLAKEHFSSTIGSILPDFAERLEQWGAAAPQLARDNHNKALASLMATATNPRRTFLESLDWAIHSAPEAGAILSDSVTIAIDINGNATPYMFVGVDDTRAIVMPLSRDKLLVGTPENVIYPIAFDYNRAAASCSHRFFIASDIDKLEMAELLTSIGERTALAIDEALRDALSQHFPQRSEVSNVITDTVEGAKEGSAAERMGTWRYQLSLPGWDKETCDKVNRVIQTLVGEMASILPLGRLDGITVAADYARALAEMDRGIPGIGAPTTVSAEIGVGIAQLVTVLREGIIKGHIVIDQGVALNLVSDDSALVEWAVHLFARELTHVALIDLEEYALPGIHLQPIRDPLTAWLYRAIDPALHGYTVSILSAGFGNPESTISTSRQLSTQAIYRMRTQILDARLAYRYDGDLDKLLGIAAPAIQQTLCFLADLLGYCAALNEPVDHEDGELTAALRMIELDKWLPSFEDDLERHRQRLGRWESFDEFLIYNYHVERILWQHGIFPWHAPDGGRFEIPLISDAAALMAAQSIT